MRNIDKYRKDIDALSEMGTKLLRALYLEVSPIEAEKSIRKVVKDGYDEYIKELPRFRSKYQVWYSEAKVLIKQLLPDRFDDFVRAYEKEKGRRNVEFDNYVIEDALVGIQVRSIKSGGIVGPINGLLIFQQQLNILNSVKSRFESSLFDIQQLVQADLFDSEIEVAKLLSKNKYYRAAGVICGVVLEKHLKQVCQDHSIKVTRSKPAVNDLNELLKKGNIIDTGTWRNIQRLGDLRNLCSHNGEREPSKDDLDDLINGVDKIIKTIF